MHIFLSFLLAVTSLLNPTTSLPKDTIVFFNTSTCPTDYGLYTSLQGRFALGRTDGLTPNDYILGMTAGTTSPNITEQAYLNGTLFPYMPPFLVMTPCKKNVTDNFATVAYLDALGNTITNYDIFYRIDFQIFTQALTELNHTQQRDADLWEGIITNFSQETNHSIYLLMRGDRDNGMSSPLPTPGATEENSTSGEHATHELEQLKVLFSKHNRTQNNEYSLLEAQIEVLEKNNSLQKEQRLALVKQLKEANNTLQSLLVTFDEYEKETRNLTNFEATQVRYLWSFVGGISGSFVVSVVLTSAILFSCLPKIVKNAIEESKEIPVDPNLAFVNAENEMGILSSGA